MTDPRVTTEILKEGEDDWVHLGVLVRTVKAVTHLSGEALLQASLETIRELLTAGWMVAGQIGTERFVPWTLASAETLARIEREWRALGHEPSLGDICWFANTPAGDARARRARSS